MNCLRSVCAIATIALVPLAARANLRLDGGHIAASANGGAGYTFMQEMLPITSFNENGALSATSGLSQASATYSYAASGGVTEIVWNTVENVPGFTGDARSQVELQLYFTPLVDVTFEWYEDWIFGWTRTGPPFGGSRHFLFTYLFEVNATGSRVSTVFGLGHEANTQVVTIGVPHGTLLEGHHYEFLSFAFVSGYLDYPDGGMVGPSRLVLSGSVVEDLPQVSSTPEPSCTALMIVGGVCIAFERWRRNRRRGNVIKEDIQ